MSISHDVLMALKDVSLNFYFIVILDSESNPMEKSTRP